MARSTARVVLYTALQLALWLAAAAATALGLYMTQLFAHEHEAAQSLFARELRASERSQMDRMITRDEWFTETCSLKNMPGFAPAVQFSGLPVINRTAAAFTDALLGRDSVYECGRAGSPCYERAVDVMAAYIAYAPVASSVFAWVWCVVVFVRMCPLWGVCGRIDAGSMEQRIREVVASQINPVDIAFDRTDSFGVRRRRADWPSTAAAANAASSASAAAAAAIQFSVGEGGVMRHGGM
jgi:hypothetical protein